MRNELMPKRSRRSANLRVFDTGVVSLVRFGSIAKVRDVVGR
jgi:hypothetical protein